MTQIIKFPSKKRKKKRGRKISKKHTGQVVNISTDRARNLSFLKRMSEESVTLKDMWAREYRIELGTADLKDFFDDLVRSVNINLTGTLNKATELMAKIERGEYRKGDFYHPDKPPPTAA